MQQNYVPAGPITRRTLLAAGMALAASPALGCSPGDARATASAETTNGVRWVTLPNGYKIWTQRQGRAKTKILLLHGGPGFSHDYMSCFADFLPKAGYEMYVYDQLGCGRSDRPTDARLWTLTRYRDEVEQVRDALGLEKIILVGHSWGGLLGIEYALLYPDRLQGFVLSSMSASFGDFATYVGHLKRALPTSVQARLLALEGAGEASGSEYKEILQKQLYDRYICRLIPWPESVRRTFANANMAIYTIMQGPNEFVINGSLKDWDRWKSLRNISVPTLVMGAEFDEMDPDSIRREARLIPGAELFISEKGSHLAMWDDQANYFRHLLRFLDGLSS